MRLPTGTFYRRFPTGGGTFDHWAAGSFDHRSATGTAGTFHPRLTAGAGSTGTFDHRLANGAAGSFDSGLTARAGTTRAFDHRSATGTAGTFYPGLTTGTRTIGAFDSRSTSGAGSTGTFVDYRIIQLILMLSLSSYFLPLQGWPRLIVLDTPGSLPSPTLVIVP